MNYFLIKYCNSKILFYPENEFNYTKNGTKISREEFEELKRLYKRYNKKPTEDEIRRMNEMMKNEIMKIPKEESEEDLIRAENLRKTEEYLNKAFRRVWFTKTTKGQIIGGYVEPDGTFFAPSYSIDREIEEKFQIINGEIYKITRSKDKDDKEVEAIVKIELTEYGNLGFAYQIGVSGELKNENIKPYLINIYQFYILKEELAKLTQEPKINIFKSFFDKNSETNDLMIKNNLEKVENFLKELYSKNKKENLSSIIEFAFFSTMIFGFLLAIIYPLNLISFQVYSILIPIVLLLPISIKVIQVLILNQKSKNNSIKFKDFIEDFSIIFYKKVYDILEELKSGLKNGFVLADVQNESDKKKINENNQIRFLTINIKFLKLKQSIFLFEQIKDKIYSKKDRDLNLGAYEFLMFLNSCLNFPNQNSSRITSEEDLSKIAIEYEKDAEIARIKAFEIIDISNLMEIVYKHRTKEYETIGNVKIKKYMEGDFNLCNTFGIIQKQIEELQKEIGICPENLKLRTDKLNSVFQDAENLSQYGRRGKSR